MDRKSNELPNAMRGYHCSKIPHAETLVDAGLILELEKAAA
ncbi:hypothetical protein [Solilutibacter pythonis]|nr:hypothetical protein [Lysobacter pythonis]